PGGAVYNALVNGLPQLFQAATGGALKLVDTSSHGFLTVALDATKARATFTFIPHGEVSTDYSKKSAAELQAKVTTAAFDGAGGQLRRVGWGRRSRAPDVGEGRWRPLRLQRRVTGLGRGGQAQPAGGEVGTRAHATSEPLHQAPAEPQGLGLL